MSSYQHQHRHRSSPLPSCFRRPSATTTPNLTTCLYNTDVGVFALSWSRTLFGRSLHLHYHHQHEYSSFHLHIKLFPTWFHNKQGSKKLNLHKPATIFWDLSSARYGSGPEPLSGFYLAIVVDGEIILLIGDSHKEAYSKTGATSPTCRCQKAQSPMILRREHVHGTKPYSTKASIGGHERHITIEPRLDLEEPRLYISIDNKRVLQIKHLKWKFRGSESIEIDGNHVQVSWDLYNWLFDDEHRRHHNPRVNEDAGYALFMFTIFQLQIKEDSCCSCRNNIHNHKINNNNNSNAASSIMLSSWPQFHHHQQQRQHNHSSIEFEFEDKKMKKKTGGRGLLRRAGRSSSFSSFSSANSSGSCSSSVMEWADNEEDEFMNLPHSGFSLLVYAWKT